MQATQSGLFFSVSIAGFTLTLWRTTNKQERLTREALVTTTRAFVFLEDFDNNFVTAWRNGNPSISNFIIVARWKNSGDTPSKNLTISLNVLYVEGDVPPNFNFLFPPPPLRTLIGPKANEWNSPILIPDPEANEAFKGRTNIYVWGRADYQDIFGNTPRRFTEFCYRIYFHPIHNEVKVQFVPYGDYNKSDYDL
jgi:hypothetical protein